jgi:sugar-specific transcriptional regulator TrmB
MTHDQLLNSLVEFGLTSTQASVYLAAVSLREATTRQISVTSGKERAQTHHALRKLQQLGLVEVTVETPARFRPIEIKLALNRLYLQQRTKLRKLDEMRRIFVRSESLIETKKTSISDSYSIVKGRINVYSRMLQAINTSKEEVTVMLSDQGLTRVRRFADLFNCMKKRSRRGVKLRIMSQISQQNLNDAKSFAKFCELRHMRNQFTNASVYDHQVGSIALSLKENLDIQELEHIAFWTTAKSFVETLATYLDSAWFLAAPLDPTIKLIEANAI